MSTLKKILALTLALAMVLSLNVFAAFNDQATINEDCVTAVEMMNTLGVIKGDNNGNFNPEKTITRAEAATMVFRLANKGADGADSYKGAKYFDDVAGHWAEGYINFCYSMNIIAGRTATTFVPEAPVTGLELAKMLLCVLKYDQTAEGYTGANWAANVQNDAFMAGLLENYGMALSVPAQRQWAAVMFYDALNCQMASYLLGQLFIQESDTNTLGYKNFGLDTTTGILVAIEGVTLDSEKTAGTGYSYVDNGDTDANNDTYKFVADTALLGQEVTVVYNTKNNSTKVYGMTATANNVVAEAPAYDVDITSGVITIGSTELTDAEGVVYVNAYNPTGNVITLTTEGAPVLAEIAGTNSSDIVKVIDNDGDGDINYAFVTKSIYAPYEINSGAVKIELGTNDINVAKNNVASKVNYVNTVADDDIVKVTANVFTGKYDIEKLDANVAKLINKVNGYKLGSTTYKPEENINAYLGENTTVPGTEIEFYTDGKFIVYAVEKDSTVTGSGLPNFVLVTAAAPVTVDDGDPFTTNDTVWMFKALSLDGKVTTYEFGKNSNGKADMSTDDVSVVYELLTNTDGTYGLKGMAKAYNKPTYDNDYVVASSTTAVNNKTARIGNIVVPTDVKFFTSYKDTSATTPTTAYAVVTLSGLKGADASNEITPVSGSWVITTAKSGINTLALGYVKLADADYSAEDTTEQVYALTTTTDYAEYDETDSKTYNYVQVVYVDGTAATLKLKEEQTLADDTLYTVKIGETSGLATLELVNIGETAAVTGVAANLIQTGSSSSVSLEDVATNPTVVLFTNDSDNTKDTIEFTTMDKIVEIFADADDDYTDNSLKYKKVAPDADDKAMTVIYFEVTAK